MSWRISLCVVALFAACATSAEIQIRETYWQELLNVGWVHVGPNGVPTFVTGAGDLEGTYHKKIRTISGEHKIILIDQRDRIWTINRSGNRKPAQYFDGKKWHQTDILARQGFGDSAGRAFLFATKSLHVLETDGKWSEQKIFDKDVWEFTDFVEDGQGRVWFYLSSSKKDEPELGVWCYEKGNWKHYTTKKGFPFPTCHGIFPLDNDRLLVFSAPLDKHYAADAYQIWSPTKKLEGEAQKLKDFDFSNKSTLAFAYTYQEKLGHVFVQNYTTNERYAFYTVTRAGEVKKYTQKDRLKQIHLAGIYENHRQVYRKVDEPPLPLPEQTGCITADGEGRIYFRGHLRVGVLWPKHLRDNQVLRLEKEKQFVRRIELDYAGVSWGQVEGKLLRWEKGEWREAGNETLQHPEWGYRMGPPWLSWARGDLALLPGKGGSMLVASVCDQYQTSNKNKLDDREPVKPGPVHWVGLQHYHEGKWSEPAPATTFLVKHRELLIENFAHYVPTTQYTYEKHETHFFTYLAEGKRIWAAFGNKIYLVEADGNLIEQAAPNPDTHPYSNYRLLQLADGQVLCVSVTKTGHVIHSLKLQRTQIIGSAFPKVPLKAGNLAVLPNFSVTSNGTLWAWVETYTRGPFNWDGEVWEFRDKAWQARPELGRPLRQDADGTVWFSAGATAAKDTILVKVKGDKTEAFIVPEAEWKDSFDKVTDKDFVWANGLKIYCLSPNSPSGKPSVSFRLLTEFVHPSPVFHLGDKVTLPGYSAKLK